LAPTMQLPLQITFHGLAHSEAIEAFDATVRMIEAATQRRRSRV